MNILLAFKAEPDAGMLAEKEWQAAAQGKVLGNTGQCTGHDATIQAK